MKRTALILEDHRAMRDALADHVKTILRDVHVLRCGSPGELPDRDDVVLALVDLDLGAGVDPIPLVRRLANAGATVIIMSAAAAPSMVQRSIQAGAWTYVPKSPQLRELDAALTAWTTGAEHLGGELAGKLVTPQVPGVTLEEPVRRALALHSTGMSHRAISQAMGTTTTEVSKLITCGIAAYRV